MNLCKLGWRILVNKVTATEIRQHLTCSSTRCSCRGHSGNTHCPSHDDKNPSLSIKEDSQGVLINCFAGCSYDQILKALNVQSHQLRHRGGAM